MDTNSAGNAASRGFLYFTILSSILVVKSFFPDNFPSFILIVGACSSLYILYFLIKGGLLAEIIGMFVVALLLGLGTRIFPIVFVPLLFLFIVSCIIQSASSLWKMRATFIYSLTLLTLLFADDFFHVRGWALIVFRMLYLTIAYMYVSRIRYADLGNGLFNLCFLILSIPILILIIASIKKSISDLFSINTTMITSKIPQRQFVSAHMRGGSFVDSYQRIIQKNIQTATISAVGGIGGAGLGAVSAATSTAADKDIINKGPGEE